MRVKKKPTAWIFAGAALVWQLIIQPLWNLSVEHWADSGGFALLFSSWQSAMTGAGAIGQYLPSSFIMGFAVGGLLFAYWDSIITGVRRLFGRHDPLVEMRAWAGTIVPYLDEQTRTLTLWFDVISVGLTPIKIGATSGTITLKLVENGDKYEYKLEFEGLDRELGTEFAARGVALRFGAKFKVPGPAWDQLPYALSKKPYPSLSLEKYRIELEDEQEHRKDLRLWEHIRLSTGPLQPRYVETFSIWEDEAQKEQIQSAIGTAAKYFGIRL